MRTTLKTARLTAIGVLSLTVLLAPKDGAGQEMTVRGRVLYNPTLPDCHQYTPCTADLALTRPEEWRPPLSAVNVVVQGTDRVAKTDREGYYEISVPSRQASLMFLYIGHNRVEIPVEARSTIDVRLTPTPLPVIERLLGLIMPRMVAQELPDIDQLAAAAEVNRETARDMLWLVIGDRRMAEHYPAEYVPDYRFDDQTRPSESTGGAP